MGFLAGKRALIVGVATDRSIAWGIAQAMHREGAELAFTYVNDKLQGSRRDLAQSLRLAARRCRCDVTTTRRSTLPSSDLSERMGRARYPRARRRPSRRAKPSTGGFLEAMTREGFRIAHDISSYSLAALAKARAAADEGPRAARC